jgi:hypothetical protein
MRDAALQAVYAVTKANNPVETLAQKERAAQLPSFPRQIHLPFIAVGYPC